MKKTITCAIALTFSWFANTTPNFVPVQNFPSISEYTVSNGMQMCYYPYLGELGHYRPEGSNQNSVYPIGGMNLYLAAGASRLGHVHCNLSIDNARLIKDIVISGSQSVSPLTNAAECTLILDTQNPDGSSGNVSVDMDAYYVVPSAAIAQYRAEDINSVLAGANVSTAQINCDLGEGVSRFSIANVGVSYN